MDNYDLTVFPLGIGQLISNLIQLDFLIRVALHLQEPNAQRLDRDSLKSANMGDVFPVNALTNWLGLKDLINEYNALEEARGESQIDVGIVDLRHALAHGRLSAPDMQSPYRLIRFSKPREGMVTVEGVDVLTPRWLDEQIRRTSRAGNLVMARIKSLGINMEE